MDLDFLTPLQLDRPVFKVDTQTLFNCYPFFNDYYIVIYLKKINIPTVRYLPVIMNDERLVANYGGYNLPSLISQVIAVGEQIKNSTFRVAYRILVLRNGWWCVYIEKRHLWDYFQSLGVVTIMSPSKSAVLDYFQLHFAAKLIKQPKFKPRKHTITLENATNSNGNDTTSLSDLGLLPVSTPTSTDNTVIDTYFT